MSVVFFYYSRRPKRLDYHAELTQIRIPRDAGLTVQHGGKELENPYLALIRFSNTGKIEIRPDDFEDRLTIHFQYGARVVAAGVVRTGPEQFVVQAKEADENKVLIDPFMLNHGDWFDLKLLADGSADFSPEVKVEGRVAGTHIRNVKEKYRGGAAMATVAAVRRFFPRPLFYLLVGVAMLATLALLSSFLNSTQNVAPNLTHQTIAKAVDILRAKGLHLGQQTLIPSNELPGTVIDQHPGSGDYIEPGGQVSVVVATKASGG
ncbi:MAG: hypothetical protein QOH66_344 [Actinomycetota bacterium]|nr:hypothetical protein [Actinomycetota bacterium]